MILSGKLYPCARGVIFNAKLRIISEFLSNFVNSICAFVLSHGAPSIETDLRRNDR